MARIPPISAFIWRAALLCGPFAGCQEGSQYASHVESQTRAVRPSNDSVRVLQTLPEFTLTSQQGQPFGSDDLNGKAWIANFVFTRCTATCPAQTAELARLQRELGRHPKSNEIRFVSISVDPECDSPDVLQKYAERFEADLSNWAFLTGQRDKIWALSKEGFKLPVADQPQDSRSPILHSSKFILVDRQHRVRGYYEARAPEEMVQLKRDLDVIVME